MHRSFASIFIISALILIICTQDLFIVTPDSYTASNITNYNFALIVSTSISIPAGTTIEINFPPQFTTLTNGFYSCSVASWPITASTPTCSIAGLILSIQNLFPTTRTFTNSPQFSINVQSINNPYYSIFTDPFSWQMVLNSGVYSTSSNFGQGIQINVASISCSLLMSPTTANQNGLLIVDITPPYYPTDGILQISFDQYWPEQKLLLASTSTIQSTSLSCLPIKNAQNSIQCTYQSISNFYIVTVNNLVATTQTGNIIFSIGSFLSPPSTMDQGKFDFTITQGINTLSACSSIMVTGTTISTFTSPQYLPDNVKVNALTSAKISFTIHSNIITSDIISITFPNDFSLSSLTNVYIANGNANQVPTITGNVVNLTNAVAYASNILQITFSQIKNPPSEYPTNSIQAILTRNGYGMQSITTGFTFSATKATISSASLTSSSLQVGVISTYTFVFIIGNSLTSTSVVQIGLPSAYQGTIGGCSPTPCSVASTKVTFSSPPTTVGSTVSLQLTSVTNPYQLGQTTSFTITTIYDNARPTSLVESVNSGLSLNLVARVMLSSNVAITSSSSVVSNYPTTITLAINNNNPLPSLAYLQIYLPPQITLISASDLTCQYGSISLSCTFDSASNMITFSYFSTLQIAAGQLKTNPIKLINLVNPSSTQVTSSFQIYIYNSNNQVIQYVTSGLPYQANTAASFYSLSLIPNNTINSALTSLTVIFNVPSKTYSNSSLLVITFPSIINIALVQCFPISLNLLALSCSVNSNTLKIIIQYNSLSTFSSTKLSLETYNNYPSLEPYPMQVDLYADSFMQNQLCSNANNLIQLQNIQVGALVVASYTFSNPYLLTYSNLNINIGSTSGASFSYLIISFPLEFDISSISCSLPASTTCTLNTNNRITITTTASFTLPLVFTILNIKTPSFTPSSDIYIQTFSAAQFTMDSNTNVKFTTSCTLPCKTCNSTSQPTVCTSCYSNTSLVSGQTILSGNSCTSFCPTGYYLDDTISTCLICSTSCLTCSAYTTCLSCNTSFLYNQSCLTTCPFGYYGFNAQCLACPTSIFCESCSSNYQCLTCISGYYYYSLKCLSSCPTPLTLPNSVTRVCDSCPQNCSECTGTFASSICTVCQPTYVLDTNRCYLSCVTAGLIAVSGVCSGCNAICQTCSLTVTNCTSCFSNSVNPYYYNFKCLAVCPSGYYPDNTTFNCLPCTTPCEMCTSVSIHSCLSCLANYYLYNNDCLSSCPQTFYSSSGICTSCVSPCLSCTQQLLCTTCVNGTYLLSNSCINQCPAGMTIINGNQCLVCSSLCKTCSSSTFCTSCYNSTYLLNGSCLATCSNGTYQNYANLTCDSCQPPCNFCSNSSYCLSCFDSTKFLVNGACVPCTFPCATCSITITNCTSCDSSSAKPYYLNNNCYASCPTGYYQNNSTYICSLCNSPCFSCTTASNASCLSCVTGYLSLLPNCFITCPLTYYNNVNQCTSCISPCVTCSSSNICLSCITNKYLLGSNCVDDCGQGMTVINSSICDSCSISCKTCLSTNSSACTSCYSTTYLFNSNCVTNCNSGYFPDVSANPTCLLCVTPCSTCITISLCLSCLDSTLFLVNNTCVSCSSVCLTCSLTRTNCTSCFTNSSIPYLVNNTCVASCSTTFYPDNSTYLCYKCNIPCQTCSTSSIRSCLTCLSGYYQLNSDCYVVCPSSYYPQSNQCVGCISPCSACTSSSVCTSCQTNYYLYGSTCVSSCGTGMAIINGTICAVCSSTCYTCLSSNNSYCTSCQNTTYLLNGICSTTCSNITYAYNVTLTCQLCIPPCLTCTSINYCLSCIDSSKFLIAGSCVGCTSPCLTCSSNPTTCTSCDQTTAYKYLLNNQCMSTCPSLYYNDSSLSQCTKCNSPCETCSSSSIHSCFTCLTGYLIYGNDCLTSCPLGFYSNNVTCLPCTAPCQSCITTTNSCTSCTNNYYLQGQNCVTNCTFGMTVFNNSICSYCSSSCLTCQSSNISACTSCYSNTYLLAGICYSTCPSTFYQDNITNTCLSCINPCATCISASSCLTCLDSTKFLVNFACVGCSASCLTCSISVTNCTSCLSSYLYNNFCYTTCPPGYFNDVSYVCSKCNFPCETCMNISIHSCLTCPNNLLIFSNDCLASCPSGYYSNNITCIACITCATCVSSTICTSCPSNLYLSGSTCVLTCPSGTIISNTANGNICQFCSSSCQTCLSSNNSFCTSCYNTTYLFNGACVTNCSSGYYGFTSSSSECLKCVAPCSTCVDMTKCLSCLDASNFLVNFNCLTCQIPCLTCSVLISNCTACNTSSAYPYLFENNCIQTCPSSYYNDPTFKCGKCTSPCENCTSSATSSCLSCLSGYLFLNNNCYTSCPSNYYQSINICVVCSSPCYNCSGPSICTSCTSGLYLNGSTCVNNCSEMAIINGNQCQFCSSSCLTCLSTSNTYCTSCQTLLYLFNGTCISTCSSGYYPDSTTSNQCLACINDCATCTSAVSCLSCKDSTKFLINATCIPCSSPCLTCSLSIINCTACNSSSAYPIFFNNQCISNCPTTYYLDSPASCAKCSSPCQTCTNASVHSCVTCLTNFFLLNNNCYASCPSGYYQSSTVCSLCQSPCLTCTDINICTSCISGQYLTGSSCSSSCANGSIAFNNVCQTCSNGCKTCLSSNSAYCTTCILPNYLYNGTCISACPSKFYSDTSSNSCLTCTTPCLTCTSLSNCLSCDSPTLFLVGYSCTTCSSQCLTCSIITTNCTSCLITSLYKFLVNNTCIQSCPDTYYDGGTYNCLKCSVPCEKCTSSSVFSCVTCLSGYSFLSNVCYTTCPAGYYSNGINCMVCSGCLTCSNLATNCLSCSAGSYLYGNTCVSNCPSGMIIINGNQCQYCASSCYTCALANNSYCTSCQAPNYLYTGSCQPLCPTYFFSNDASRTCIKCVSPCLQCLSLSLCLSCANALMFLQNNTCLSSCSYPLVGINKTCYQCSSQCLTCTQTVDTCLLCNLGFYFFSSTFTCSLYCNFYILAKNMSQSGNNECTKVCPSGTYNDSSSQYCQTCPTGCKTCISMNNCSLCQSGYNYYSYFCYNPCPSAAPYAINSICIMCNITNCQTCYNTTYCSVCSGTTLLIANGNQSTCISSCPSGTAYNTTALICQTVSSITTTSNVVSSALPSYTFLISAGVMSFIIFLLKFQYIHTLVSKTMFISFSIILTSSLINILYIEIINSGLSNGNFQNISVSTYIILSSGTIQLLSSVGSVISIIKIKDPQLVQLWRQKSFMFIIMMAICSIDSTFLFIVSSGIFNLEALQIQFKSKGMIKLLKFILFVNLFQKIINATYSSVQINYFKSGSTRLLTMADYPINQSYTIQMLIISFVVIFLIIYLIYRLSIDTKSESLTSKSDSNQSIIDDKDAFDKRNQSNSQILLSIQNSDMIVDINSIKDEKDLSDNNSLFYVESEEQDAPLGGRKSKRIRKGKKITPDQMLKKLQQIPETPQEGQAQIDISDVAQQHIKKQDYAVFDFDNNQSGILSQTIKQEDVQIDNNLQGIKLVEQNSLTMSKQQISGISQIIYNDNQGEKSSNYNDLDNIEPQKTKTQIINIVQKQEDSNQKTEEKHSPSQLSNYIPNTKIEEQFRNSYFDDAHKFNQYEQKHQKNPGIKFVEVKSNFIQEESIQEVSFQNKQKQQNNQNDQSKMEVQQKGEYDDLIIEDNFHSNVFDKQKIRQQIAKRNFKKNQDFFENEIIEQPEKTYVEELQVMKQGYEDFIKIDKINVDDKKDEHLYKSNQEIIPIKTPIENSFFNEKEDNDQEEEDIKPSDQLKGNRYRKKKKAEIILPKNQIQKQIMNIYQKKPIVPIDPKKKKGRYDLSTKKKPNQVQFEIEDQDFIQQSPQNQKKEEKIQRNSFLGRMSANKQNEQTDMPVRPSQQLRKNSFKKIGQFVLEGSQSSEKKL